MGTLDTIAGQLGKGGFGHAYFDAVITDECHRSLYGAHRATLDFFDAIHIGLSAAPNPGELQWVSENERQLVRSTYLFFDCWDSAKQIGKPTFAYDIQYGSDQWGQLKLIRSVTRYLGPYSTITGALWPEANGRRSNWTCAR